MDKNSYTARIETEPLESRQHVWIGVLVVGAKNIHQQVVAPLQFVGVVGNVGQPIGGLTGALDQDPVVVAAQPGPPQPGGVVFLVS